MRAAALLVTVTALAATEILGGARDAAPVAIGQARPSSVMSPEQLDRAKRDAVAEVEGMRVMTQQMVDQVFSFGELGYQEFETSKYLTGILQKNGFTIQTNVAGMPTAWTATWGSGKPVIALGSDIDDIPQASQKPGVAYHAPLIAGAQGTGRAQHGLAAADHGGPCREEDHGARPPVGMRYLARVAEGCSEARRTSCARACSRTLISAFLLMSRTRSASTGAKPGRRPDSYPSNTRSRESAHSALARGAAGRPSMPWS